MSIEGSSTAISPKVVAGAESQSAKGKGKTKSGGEADALAGGGFMALLASLEPEAVVGGIGLADQSDATSTQLSAADETQPMAVLPLTDPSTLLPQNLPNDLAMLLAQAGEVTGQKLSASSDEQAVGMRGGIRLTSPAIGANKPEVSMATSASLVSDERSVGAKGGIRLSTAATGADKPEMLIGTSGLLAADKSGDFRQHVDALLAQAAQALPALTSKTRSAELQSGASLAESRALQQSFRMEVVAGEAALSGALAASGMGDNFLRQADRAVARYSVMPTGYGLEGSWGHQALLAGGRAEASSAVADPSMLSLESMVADTVSYWVTQGVQNAELKLDGFGDHPVEVSISLKGDEAHIDFRTDQPEIRQILEGAVAHLKDLLTSEGLVLSGVSVGTSGQDGTGAQEQRNRPGARQANITTTDTTPTPTESLQRVNPPAGRALDLFV